MFQQLVAQLVVGFVRVRFAEVGLLRQDFAQAFRAGVFVDVKRVEFVDGFFVVVLCVFHAGSFSGECRCTNIAI